MHSVKSLRPLHNAFGEDQTAGEYGVAVLWPVAFRQEAGVEAVLEDLRRRFQVLAVFENSWDGESGARNYERFYCNRDYPGRGLQAWKGSGPFLVAVLRDEAPDYAWRDAPQGRDFVNANFFDAKQDYREWLGREHGVHLSDHRTEGWRDLAFMFGPAVLQELTSNGSFVNKHVVGNTFGLGGWNSIEDALSMLNYSARYVLLSDLESLLHSDVDAEPLEILTEDYLSTMRVLDVVAPAGVVAKWGGRFKTRLIDRTVPVEIRFVGDDYIATDLASRVLNNRVLKDGVFYMPSPDDRRVLTAYRTVSHGRSFVIGDESGRRGTPLANPTAERAGGDDPDVVLSMAGIDKPSVPRDVTAYFDFRRSGYPFPTLRTALRGIERVGHWVVIFAVATYRSARSAMMAAFPWLRYIRRAFRKTARRIRKSKKQRIRPRENRDYSATGASGR